MKPDVKKIIADIKATKGNRKYCNGLAGTLQDDNYVSSICKYVKTVTPERIDLLIDYVENLEVKVLDTAEQLANAESKCRELAAENAALKEVVSGVNSELYGQGFEVSGWHLNGALEPLDNWFTDNGWGMPETPATDAFLTEVRAQGVEMYADNLDSGAEDAERDGFDDAVKFLRSEASGVRLFAAQLRKGDKS
ncbi:TPA: hypothetical protein ACP60A_000376 [Escherichia coli]|uniref:hypothetical protein n=1 Tax=Escherichia coli TaxID=562 RepID=UPI000F579DFB|nr:hypothetical protein [Escherichia coli]EHO2073486.1 hypothetical protein [Escherichia coli]EJI6883841.1 hypothetical protein [Escherichia coli]ELT0371731.1 hypothetical protein [Escherichia coli]ELX9820723.1 hypothetical protein [Escherichia coli]MBE0322737.1 hypothetical protein [Escherichia coli]